MSTETKDESTQNVSDSVQDTLESQPSATSTHDGSQDPQHEGDNAKKDAIIASLRKEAASWRVKLRELEKHIGKTSSQASVNGEENPGVNTKGDWQASYEKLAQSHRKILVRDLAKEKGVDPEVLEAVAQKRGIDVLADEGYDELENLIKEKKWGRKATSEFGYSGSTHTAPEKTQPTNINDAVGRLFTSK